MTHLSMWVLALLSIVMVVSGCELSSASYRPNAAKDPDSFAVAAATTSLSQNNKGPAAISGDAIQEQIDPPPTFTPMISPTPPTATRTVVPFPAANSPATEVTRSPYAGLSVAELARREFGGGQLQIVETLETNDSFTRYLINYPSDGLIVYGFMNVPNEGTRFPVAIVLHGYVDPAEYRTADYTTRYADHLAESGYFVLHPNLRGFPPSDDGSNAFRVGLAVDVLNLIAVIREQSKDLTGYLRRADTDDINLWGHSMGGGVVLRVIAVDNSPYMRSAVLYGAMSGDEQSNYEKILQWSAGAVGEFELATPSELLKAISPIYHLDRINTPVSIHHGAADTVVPPEWSEDLCRRLQLLQKTAECHVYENMPHTFRGANDELFMRRTAAFFDQY